MSGGVDGQGFAVSSLPMIRQELIDAVGGMGGESGEDVLEVGEGVDVVELASLDQAEHDGRARATASLPANIQFFRPST